ncbi:MAG: PP2C family serine/threonine-protein phosphatase [bacterium]
MDSRIIAAGASCTGQAHLKTKTPNQDSYLIREYESGLVLAAADGLGSRKYSHLGSRAICKAVCNAFERWDRLESSDVEKLVELVNKYWFADPSLAGDKSEYATTCLFAIYLKTGELLIAQLGDGIILYKIDEESNVLQEKEDDFSNFTKSIHNCSYAGEWKYKSIDMGNRDLTLMLATDGVSEDLIVEKRGEFLDYLKKRVSQGANLEERNNIISGILEGWITKYHNDDKTLLLLYKEDENGNISGENCER